MREIVFELFTHIMDLRRMNFFQCNYLADITLRKNDVVQLFMSS